MKFLFLICLWSGNVLLFCFFNQHKSAFVNKLANFKRSNVTSTAVIKLTRQKNVLCCNSYIYVSTDIMKCDAQWNSPITTSAITTVCIHRRFFAIFYVHASAAATTSAISSLRLLQ